MRSRRDNSGEVGAGLHWRGHTAEVLAPGGGVAAAAAAAVAVRGRGDTPGWHDSAGLVG